MFVLVWNRGRRTTKKREPICLGAAGSGSISRMWKCISGAFHLMMMVIVQEKGHTYITCQWNGWPGMWSEERFLCFLSKCFLGFDKLFYDSLWREYCYLLKTRNGGIVVKAWGAREGPALGPVVEIITWRVGHVYFYSFSLIPHKEDHSTGPGVDCYPLGFE